MAPKLKTATMDLLGRDGGHQYVKLSELEGT